MNPNQHPNLLCLPVWIGLLVGAAGLPENASAQVPSFNENQQLTANDGTTLASFGQSVASAGEIIVAGAPGDDDQAGNAGAVYVFERDLEGILTQSAKLTANDGAANDSLGWSVATDGQRIAATAVADDGEMGSVYIFENVGGNWLQAAKLFALDGNALDQFGHSVAISGDRLLVGSHHDSDLGSQRGSAYVFEVSGGRWVQVAKLTAAVADFDQFGRAVSLSGDHAFVGAHGFDGQGDSSGAVFAYQRQDIKGKSVWLEIQQLEAFDGGVLSYFGSAVNVAGNLAVVGANLQDGFQGAAYIYRLGGGQWLFQAKLVASDAASGAFFGMSVAIRNSLALIGSSVDRAYLFRGAGTTWSEVSQLVASDDTAGFDGFATWVALSAGEAAMGAPQWNGSQGAIYLAFLENLEAPDSTTQTLPTLNGAARYNQLELQLGTGSEFFSSTDTLEAMGIDEETLLVIDDDGDDGLAPPQEACGCSLGGLQLAPQSGAPWFYEKPCLTLSGQGGPVPIPYPNESVRVQTAHHPATTGPVPAPSNSLYQPFGPAGWHCNYRHYFTQNPLGPGDHRGSLDVTGFGRTDRFYSRPSALPGVTVWEGSAGRFDLFSYAEPGGVPECKVRLRDGTTLEFLTSGHPDQANLTGILQAIVSRNGNRIEFVYESGSNLLSLKLLKIVDLFGRETQVFHDAPHPEYIGRIVDFSGRTVHFTYDVLGRLETMRTPAVLSTNGLNDFPSGKTTVYRYDATLPSYLADVVYPNEEAVGGLSGTARFSFSYDTNPFSPQYGFVTSRRIGNQTVPFDQAAGGIYDYSYLPLQESGTANEAVMQVTMYDRRGTQVDMDFNAIGNVLSATTYTQGFRPLQPTQTAFVTNFAFNQDGDLTRWIQPELNTSDRFHVDPDLFPRTSQSNEVEKLLQPGPRVSDQLEIRHQIVYEPVFNLPFQAIDPRGFEAGNNPADFAYTFLYDYMEDLDAAADHFFPLLGMDSKQQLLDLFASLGITDLQMDLNGDGFTDQQRGNLVQLVPPAVALPSSPTASPTLQYNDYGQLVRHEDAEGNVTTWQYFGALDIDGDGVNDVLAAPLGRDPTTGGFLSAQVRDADGVALTTLYEYSSQIIAATGEVLPPCPGGMPTKIISPRGIGRCYLINELGQVVKEIDAAEVPAGLTAFSYEEHTLYDSNDNVIEVREQNQDDLDGNNDFIVHQFEYDILDQLRREILDSGGPDQVINQFDYDESQNLIRKIRGAGSSHEATEEWFYDERNILVSHARGVGSAEESVFTSKIDNNGNITTWLDHDGSDQSITTFDGYDRPIVHQDRMQNQTIYVYDSAANVINVQWLGPVDDSASGNVLLAEVDSVFDPRGRPILEEEHIFHYAGKTGGAIQAGAHDPANQKVRTRWVYDAAGRTIQTLGADLAQTTFEYDGAHRLTKVIDAEGNEKDYLHDGNGNIIAIQEVETSALLALDEVFVTTVDYDALDREARHVQPGGETTFLHYDSRDHFVRLVDALGNETEMRYDRLDRLVDQRRYLSSSGLGASASNKDSSQGGGDGVLQTRQTWDPLNRLLSRTDDRGNTTSYGYDDLDRKVRCDFADGTFESWSYNGDDELLTHVNQNGSVASWTSDAAGRPYQVTLNHAASPTTLGTTQQNWGYDGLDRVVRWFDDNGAGDNVEVVLFYDSLSRPIRERQIIASQPALDVVTEWRAEGSEVAHIYPNSRRVERQYDALGRLVEVHQEGSPQSIAQFSYVGPSRTLQMSLGNGAVLDKRNFAGTSSTTGSGAGYNFSRRSKRHEWQTASGRTLVHYDNTYNATHRRISESRHHLGATDTYAFDSSYRMLEFNRNGLLASRSLDGVDNMLSFTDEGQARNPTVDGLPGEAGMLQYSDFDGLSRQHDANASLVDDGRQQYFYDYRNRLVEVRDLQGQLLARYSYDALGRRVQKTQIGGSTRYLYRDRQVLEERNQNNQVTRQFVTGQDLDEHLQMRVFGPARNTPQSLVGPAGGGGRQRDFYYHSNSQGFVGAVSNAAAQVVEYYEYSMLGRATLLAADGSTPIAFSRVGNPYLFQGRRYDSESDLYDFRNRYYDANTGRFLTMDPNENGGNWAHRQGNGYEAFGQDCWNNNDPLGLDWTDLLPHERTLRKIDDFFGGFSSGVTGGGWVNDWCADRLETARKFYHGKDTRNYNRDSGAYIVGEAVGEEVQDQILKGKKPKAKGPRLPKAKNKPPKKPKKKAPPKCKKPEKKPQGNEATNKEARMRILTGAAEGQDKGGRAQIKLADAIHPDVQP